MHKRWRSTELDPWLSSEGDIHAPSEQCAAATHRRYARRVVVRYRRVFTADETASERKFLGDVLAFIYERRRVRKHCIDPGGG